MRLTSALVSVFATTLLASQAHAYLIGFTILDHDFVIDSGYSAYYNYNGANADTLTMNAAPAGIGYRYLEEMSTLGSSLGVGFHPIYNTATDMMGGAATLELTYDQSSTLVIDGIAGANLNGTSGSLIITGYVGEETPTTLVEMIFTNTSLWSPPNNRTATLAAVGTVKTFFGQDISNLNVTAGLQTGGFVFNAKTPNVLFTSAAYDPLAPTDKASVLGRVSGESGLASAVPEPASLGLLGLGALGLLTRRGRK